MREQQVNDTLRVLDELHRLRQIERDDYRRRRRQLLEPLCDGTGCSGRDTVRRALPVVVTPPTGAMGRRHDPGEPEVAVSRGRRVGVRLAFACVAVLGVVAVCWLVTTA